MNQLPSEKIPVDYFEAALIVPLHLQALKSPEGSYVKPELDPGRTDFLDHWVDWIRKWDTNWSEIDNVNDNGYPPARGENAYPAYSEFCYFHPFVRNLLYVTRGDKRESKQSLVRNRNLRILKREDFNRFTVTYSMKPDAAEASSELEYQSQFRLKSCWLYLFDTQIAMLGIRLIHEKTTFQEQKETENKEQEKSLNLRIVQRVQDVMRHLYAPYWSVYSDGNRVVQNSAHTPSSIELSSVMNEKKTREKNSYFGNSELKFENDGIARYCSTKLINGESGDILPPDAVTASKEQVEGFNEHVKAFNQHLKAFNEHKKASIDQVKASQKHRENVIDHREPFTVEVWKNLLSPIPPQAFVDESKSNCGCGKCRGLRFEHIRDERAILMSYVSVGKSDNVSAGPGDKDSTIPIRRISDGDWLRLACVDSPGSPSTMPYSPEFFRGLESPLQNFAYDRFWHSTGNCSGLSADNTQAMGHSWMSTRWLCSGYSFTCVGDSSDRVFFRDEVAGALSHFRHHYFALTMIAMFHHASLLVYKHRLAEAADNMLSTKESSERVRNVDFRDSVERLAREIMRFRTLYWFSEVSNQIQGAELFELYRRHLRLQDLFGHVTGDAESAVALLRQWDAEDQSRATQSLAVLGAFMLIAGPLVSHLNDVPPENKTWVYGMASLIIAGLVLFCIRIPTAWLQKRSGWDFGFSRSMRFLARLPLFVKIVVGIACIGLGIGGLVPIVQEFSLKTSISIGVNPAASPNAASISSSSLDSNSSVNLPSTAPGPSIPLNAINAPSSSAGQNPKPSLNQSEDSLNEPSVDSSKETNNNSGSNPSEDNSAPQKPDSGNAPPNQEAGGGGDASASPVTKTPEP